MGGKIFISYRRTDTQAAAGWLHERLCTKFGNDSLFMDVDSMGLGVDFVEHIHAAVAQCDVLLAIIGPGWLDAADADGSWRLDNPNDFVRVEIATALARKIPVIPILLDGTPPPKKDELPEDIEHLSTRNGLKVRTESFRRDVEPLERALDQLLKAAEERRKAIKEAQELFRKSAFGNFATAAPTPARPAEITPRFPLLDVGKFAPTPAAEIETPFSLLDVGKFAITPQAPARPVGTKPVSYDWKTLLSTVRLKLPLYVGVSWNEAKEGEFVRFIVSELNRRRNFMLDPSIVFMDFEEKLAPTIVPDVLIVVMSSVFLNYESCENFRQEQTSRGLDPSKNMVAVEISPSFLSVFLPDYLRNLPKFRILRNKHTDEDISALYKELQRRAIEQPNYNLPK